MTFKATKDFIEWKLNHRVHIFYLWWGIDPWHGMKGATNDRIFEFGIGTRSWELFRIK